MCSDWKEELDRCNQSYRKSCEDKAIPFWNTPSTCKEQTNIGTRFVLVAMIYCDSSMASGSSDYVSALKPFSRPLNKIPSAILNTNWSGCRFYLVNVFNFILLSIHYLLSVLLFLPFDIYVSWNFGGKSERRGQRKCRNRQRKKKRSKNKRRMKKDSNILATNVMTC